MKRNVYWKIVIQRHGFENEFYFTSAVEIISIVFYHKESYSNKSMKSCNSCLLIRDDPSGRKNAMYSVCTSNERLKTVASNDFILIGFCFGLIRTNKSQVSQNVDCFPWKYSERKTKNNFEIIHLHKILSNLTWIRARKLILLVCDNIRTVDIVIFICSQSPAFPNRKQNSVNLFWKISAVRKSDGHNVILTHRWG